MTEKVILSRKKTGFSKISDKMEMKVLLDEPYIPEGKRQLLKLLVESAHGRGDGSYAGTSKYYYIMPGPHEEEMLYVMLHRKTKDVYGEVRITVMSTELNTSLEEEREKLKEVKTQKDEMVSVFGFLTGKDKDEVVSVDDMINQANDLLGKKFGRPGFRS